MNCAEMGQSPGQLLADWLAGGRLPMLSQATDRTVVFTHSGRSAIHLAAQIWGLSEKDEVLVPAYNCGSEISPLVATGARVSMYRVSAGAKIDSADLCRRLTSRTRLVYVIHYFGRPTDLTELVPICRARGIKLLEDCALSLFSAQTGQVGDGAIFSFYKTLPACRGGALVLREAQAADLPPLEPNRRMDTLRDALSLINRWAKAQQALVPFSYKSARSAPGRLIQPDIPGDYYWRGGFARRAPRTTVGAVRRADAAKIVRKRRRNYELLNRLLSDTSNISPLWVDDVLEDPQTCPLGLPILVGDKDRWCDELNDSKIAVSPWWSGCHKDLNWSEYSEALDLKARLILLPVHQQLGPKHMHYIAQKVKWLSAKY
jgi:dTDP-4-amino-4,6-dideoxygalactose transaminase